MSDGLRVASTGVAAERDRLRHQVEAHEIYEIGLRKALHHWIDYGQNANAEIDRLRDFIRLVGEENRKLRAEKMPLHRKIVLWMMTR